MLKRILKKLGLFNIVRGAFVKIGFVEEKKILYKIGNVKRHNAQIDTLIPQMVEIGDNFTSAPGVQITAHDASTFKHTGKYRIEKVTIGNNVFIGANSVILPGVTLGDNVIIGAGSVVTKDIPANTVAAGNPIKIMCSVDDYIKKCEKRNVLYDSTKTFLYKRENVIPLEKPKDLIEFQEYIMKQVKEREQKK